LETFLRKQIGGLLFDANERGDGKFFDPSFMEIERILEIERSSAYPDTFVSSKKAHTNDDKDSDCQFLVKWKYISYSQSTYEFESDLISMNIEYGDCVESFFKNEVKSRL